MMFSTDNMYKGLWVWRAKFYSGLLAKKQDLILEPNWWCSQECLDEAELTSGYMYNIPIGLFLNEQGKKGKTL